MRLFRRRNENDRPIGPWYAQWYDADGVAHQRSTRALDKKAAEDIARQWERDAADPDHAATRTTSLTDVLDTFLRERSSQVLAGRRSAETVTFYKKKAGHLVRFFEQPDPDRSQVPFIMKNLRARHVDEFVEQRRTEGASESTIQKELTTLRAALKLAKRRGLWTGDVMAVMPHGFSPEYKPRERFLSFDEVCRLLSELPGQRSAVVAFIVATSAEWRAVERAQPGDVRLDDSVVLLRGTKRATRHRPVPVVTDEQRELLAFALRYAGGDEELLFLRWKNVRRDLHEACRRAGCRATGCLTKAKHKVPCAREDCAKAAMAPCSPNDLRRTFAHWMRAKGMPLELVAPLMGHADTRMVERVYGRFSESELISRARASVGCSECAVNPVDSLAPGGLPGLGAPLGEPCFAGISVPRDGVEPPTRGFSIPCSTN
jgi:integrase